MKKNLIKTVIVSLVTVGLLLGFAACGDSDDNPSAGGGNQVFTAEDVDVYQDLQDVLAAMLENLTWGDHVWEQIMLADDVPSPEMKYGLLVVPFFPSDLTLRHTRTVDISGGNFVVQITSAATNIIWSIDQDGIIRRVN